MGRLISKGHKGVLGGDGNVPKLDWDSRLHSGYFCQQSMNKSIKIFFKIIFTYLAARSLSCGSRDL